jgi:starch-binding outer membrane protein, SusD/RagB family
MKMKSFRRLALLAPLAAVGLGACSDLLSVDNPGKLNDPYLNDPLLVDAMVNTAANSFNTTIDDLVFAGAILGDEAVNSHNFDQWKRIDLRLIEEDNSILNSNIYQPIQAARFAADSLAGRVKTVYGDTLNNKGRLALARMKTYGGYSYVYLGEYFCEAPINLSASLPSDSLLNRAISDFAEAIAYAKAVRGTAAVAKTPADSIQALATIGTARAYLQLGNKAKAIEFAQQVVANQVFAGDFEWRVAYSDNTSLPNNALYSYNNGSSRQMGVDASFRGLKVGTVNDSRVRHSATAQPAHNALTVTFSPYVGPSHGGYDPSLVPAQPTSGNPAGVQVFQKNTNIRLASTLEAQYIIAEAQGATPATLTFVNQRRAFGAKNAGGTDVSLSGDALMAELRDQRRRDFFLDGHRLGDLRRYKAQYGVDQFPSGLHPNVEWGNYGTATCFIPTLNEKIGNPNY